MLYHANDELLALLQKHDISLLYADKHVNALISAFDETYVVSTSLPESRENSKMIFAIV